MDVVSTSRFAFVDVYLLKASLLPANAPTFRAGISIGLVGNLDNRWYICSGLESGSFLRVIAAPQTSSDARAASSHWMPSCKLEQHHILHSDDVRS